MKTAITVLILAVAFSVGACSHKEKHQSTEYQRTTTGYSK